MSFFFHREDACPTLTYSKLGIGCCPLPPAALGGGPHAFLKTSRSESALFFLPLAQSLVLLWMILELATSLVALTGAKSSRKLTAKRISCQKSQFWVI